MHVSILLFAVDRLDADVLAGALAQSGHAVTVATSVEEVVRQAPLHGLVMVDHLDGAGGAREVVAAVQGLPAGPSIPIIAVAQANDIEERIALLEAGADDVIVKPFDIRELEARIDALASRFDRIREHASAVPLPPITPHGRRVVSVFSPKGGVGTTTIAVNLAVLAAERRRDGAAILDLDLQFGQVATHLDLEVKVSLLELVRDDAAVREPEVFRTYGLRHASGLHLYAAPTRPGFADLFSAQLVEALVDRAAEAYDTVIVDAGSTLDERTLSVFARSDLVVIPVIPEIPALRATRALLDQLLDTGALGNGPLLVLNSIFAKDLLRLDHIEGALGGPVAADLPYDGTAFLKAAVEGVPVVIGSPRSPAAEGLRHLALRVLGAAAPGAVAAPDKGKKPRFGLGLR